jgi:hypothetical protein
MGSKKKFLILSKEIKDYRNGTRKNEDIYLLAYIKLCTNYYTGISKITQPKMSEKIGIPVSTIKNMISRLKDSNLVDVETRFIDGKWHNTYKFNLKPANFFFINPRFFHTSHSARIKGFLLLLKSICLDNSNRTYYNKTTIAKILHQDRALVPKLITECLQLNLLLELEEGFELPTNFFDIYGTDKSKSERKNYEQLNTTEAFILSAIVNHCNIKGTMLFAPHLGPIKTIAAKYYQKEKYENDDLNLLYLPAVLDKKCENLPLKIESLNYFLEVLNLEYHEFSQPDTTIIL